jgi:hypothetical protein
VKRLVRTRMLGVVGLLLPISLEDLSS